MYVEVIWHNWTKYWRGHTADTSGAHNSFKSLFMVPSLLRPQIKVHTCNVIVWGISMNFSTYIGILKLNKSIDVPKIDRKVKKVDKMSTQVDISGKNVDKRRTRGSIELN